MAKAVAFLFVCIFIGWQAATVLKSIAAFKDRGPMAQSWVRG